MTTIYHNARCSKSRATLALLEDKARQSGDAPIIINYIENPPSKTQLGVILSKLNLNAEQIVRKGETLFKELGLGDKTLSNAEWIEVLNSNPQLIERPIVVNGDKAAIGRPIENVMAIL